MADPRRQFELGAIDPVRRRVAIIASTANPGLSYEWVGSGDKGKLVEVWERIVDWDLSRFAKNGPILWAHDCSQIPIGTAEDVEWDPKALELRMWSRFGTERANPKSEEVWRAVEGELLRAVSVGFRRVAVLKEERRDGKIYRDIRAKLQEVSFVPVGEDEDALLDGAVGQRATTLLPDGSLGERPLETPEETEEERRERLAKAGKDLASARKRRSDAGDDNDDETVRRFDYYGRLGKVERTQVGGIRVPARLTRTGVLEYRLPDGSVRRELRLPEEVFHEDSLATLRSAPVTDIEHHRAFIGTHNWKQATLGHAEDIRADGDFVAGALLIQDARAIADVDAGKLQDISCGYACHLDFTPGEWNGQRYDAIQRRIRYNHVAVLPPGRGRAGTDVSIRLDSKDAVCVGETPEEEHMKTIRLDGKDYEIGSDAHLAKLDDMHRAEIKRLESERDKAIAERDTLQAKFDASEKAQKEAEEEAEQRKKKELEEEAEAEKERKKRERKRRGILLRAARALRALDDEDAEEKMDALDEKSDRDLMLEVIRADDKDFDDQGKSDDYIAALFDIATKKARRSDGVDAVVAKHRELTHADAVDTSAEEKARQENIKRSREAWKQPLT
jgi:hypothetical protein